MSCAGKKLEVYRRDRILSHADDISKDTGVPTATILGKSRSPSAVRCRHRLMAILWREGLSIGEVARALRMDHTSVIAALRGIVGADEYKAEILARGKVRIA